MTLGTAVLLFLIVLAGIAVVSIFLREKRRLCIACIILLALIALALAGYIGLTVFFRQRSAKPTACIITQTQVDNYRIPHE